jgi:hypothetical protein
MKWQISLMRASLASLVWTVVFGVPLALRPLMNGDHYLFTGFGSPSFFFSLLSIFIGFPAIGLILAFPFTGALAVWEAWTRPNERQFLIGSLVIGILWSAILIFPHIQTVHEYNPSFGFTGDERIALTNFVAAACASYTVGRYLPQTGDNPAMYAYRRYGRLVGVGFCASVFLLVLCVFFPTFGGSSLASAW